MAERGEGCERENAERMLADFLKKHNIYEAELEAEEVEHRFFNVKTKFYRLFTQCVRRVGYKFPIYGKHDAKIHGGNYSVKCTVAQWAEIESMLTFYSNLLEKEEEIFFNAFCSANDLLVRLPESESRSVEELSPEEFENWQRSRSMAANIKSETYRKQIERHG